MDTNKGPNRTHGGGGHVKHGELIFGKLLRIHDGEGISSLQDAMKTRYIHGKTLP